MVLGTVDPRYTSEAMRQKIQGEVHVEAVVRPDGTVDEARVVKSLDSTYGLDANALTAARQWLFAPGRLRGEAVPVRAILILTFRLH
jgi:TonB family protein